MALGTPTVLTSGSSTADATSQPTASVTLVADRVYVFQMSAGLVGVASSTPTFSGNGSWTIVEHAAVPNDAVTQTVAVCVGTGTTGVVTLTYPLSLIHI